MIENDIFCIICGASVSHVATDKSHIRRTISLQLIYLVTYLLYIARWCSG